MSQSIILTAGQVRQWGERRAPLPRVKAYAFSLDLVFEEGDMALDRAARRAAAQGKSEAFRKGSQLFHVQDEVLIKSADGKVRDVPNEAKVVNATVLVCGSATCTGADVEARILALYQEEAFLSMDMTGVLAPSGSLLRVWSDPGANNFKETVQTTVSIRTETASASFRWLVQNQLFGWGCVQLQCEKGKKTARFTYDLYSMAG
jgi:hypothetical protein